MNLFGLAIAMSGIVGPGTMGLYDHSEYVKGKFIVVYVKTFNVSDDKDSAYYPNRGVVHIRTNAGKIYYPTVMQKGDIIPSDDTVKLAPGEHAKDSWVFLAPPGEYVLVWSRGWQRFSVSKPK